MIHCTFVKIWRCMYFLKITLLRAELMRNTFDVGRVTAGVYAHIDYQENSGTLHILIRYKEYVDKLLRCSYSVNGNF